MYHSGILDKGSAVNIFSPILSTVFKVEISLNLKAAGITYLSALKKWKKWDLSFVFCAGTDRRRPSFSHSFPHERWLGEFREIPTGGCTTVNKWKRFVVTPTMSCFYWYNFFLANSVEWKQRPNRILALELLRPKGFLYFWQSGPTPLEMIEIGIWFISK